MSALETLTAQVAATKSVMESAEVLIHGLAEQLKNAGTDPEKLAALAAELDAADNGLAAAVAANTMAEPVVEYVNDEGVPPVDGDAL